MNDDRKLHFARDIDMQAEQVLLRFAIRMVVIIVEPGFADADDLWLVGRGAKFFPGQIDMIVRIVRVNSHAGIHIGRGARRANDLRPFSLLGRYVEKTLHTGIARAIECAHLVFDETFVFEVAMAVDEHQAGSASGSSRRGKIGVGLSIAWPAATSASNQSASPRSA